MSMSDKVNALFDKDSQSNQHSNSEKTDSNTGQHYVVAEEYTIGVPLFRPKAGLLDIMKSAGAEGEIFTKKEICLYLKTYIGSKKLYDTHDPRLVYCKRDPLGFVFGVEKFTINEALSLISKCCHPVPDTCIKRKCRYVTRSSAGTNGNPSLSASSSNAGQGIVTIAVCRSSPVVTSSTNSHVSHPADSSQHVHSTVEKSFSSDQVQGASGGHRSQKQKRKHKDSSSSSGSKRQRQTSLSITYSDNDNSKYPWYFSVEMQGEDEKESEVLSVQEKETLKIEDSTDDLWFVDEEDSIAVEVSSDNFSVEYEVQSSSDVTCQESDSSVAFSGQDLVVVCSDSDVPFWADSSEEETDTELTDADKWLCPECNLKNSPIQRYCSRCWKLRPGWLSEKKKKDKRDNQAGLGEISSSESDEGTKYYTKSASHADNGNVSSSSDSKSSIIPLSSKETDSGVYTSSQQLLSSQETESAKDVWNPAELDTSNCSEKLDLGMRRTFLNYRTNEERLEIDNNEVDLTGKQTEQEKSSSHSSAERLILPNTNAESADSKSKTPIPGDPGMCVLCLSRPKTGSIIHGSTGHQVCCFRCARRLKRQRRPCPVCRRSIQKVVKNFIV